MLALLSTFPLLLAATPQGSGFGACAEVLDALLEQDLETAAFVEEHVDPALVQRESADVLADVLLEVRDTIGRAEPSVAYPLGPGHAVFEYEDLGNLRLHVRLAKTLEHLVDLWIEDGPGLDSSAEHAGIHVGPFTWDALADQMREQEELGFTGALLVYRDGEVFLDKAYGMADREAGRPNRPDTVFAVGSTPIDFTHVAVLLLEEAGALTLDQPLPDFFEGVPAEKQGITIGQLMTGRSGLQDFLGRPEDANPDHTWIDRDEALRRIFEDELLFAPGTGRAHSHAAWGVLAAVVEVVSGQSYQEFTRENLFEPAGMEDTGFFGEEIPEERLAIGYGFASNGEVNAPPYWGPTSWLVMGSGGMVSTTGDMLRFQRALAEGVLLSPEGARRYWGPGGGLAAAGDMFGFEIRYTQGPGDLFVLVSNAGGPAERPRLEEIARALLELQGS